MNHTPHPHIIYRKANGGVALHEHERIGSVRTALGLEHRPGGRRIDTDPLPERARLRCGWVLVVARAHVPGRDRALQQLDGHRKNERGG